MATDSTAVDLLRVSVSGGSISVEMPWWLIATIALLAFGLVVWRIVRSRRRFRRFDLVSVDIDLGGVGTASFQPNTRDIEVAHRVWAELVTRKAALPIDPQNDVIVEIYDSWYALFGRIRDLVASIPAHLIREEASTREIVRITTEALNQGLRPHLTKWQARFRNWYEQNRERLQEIAPQELQREFPEYEALMADIEEVNGKMIRYARALRAIAHGRQE